VAIDMKPSGSRGFSLVELMVAMTIGLIGIVIITQAYVVSEDQKRTTVSGGEAQQNGILALQFIQQELLMAGYGTVAAGALGCVVNATSDAGVTSYQLRLVPAIVRPSDPVAGTDSITVLYGTAAGASGSPAVLRANHSVAATNFQFDNTIGFTQNDFIVAYQSGKPCTLMQTTNDPTVGGNTVLQHSVASTYNVAANANLPQSPPYATSGYDSGSLIFNLGQPTNVRYQITDNKLVQVNLADGSNATTELVDGIVAIRAQYAVDTATPHPAVPATPLVANGDSLVNVYVDPRADGTPNHAAFGTANATQIAAGWGRVYAVRVGIVARSSLRDKTDVSPATIELWAGGPTYTVPDRKYRYKVYHTVVPVRNMVWRRPGI
jgi:type IV pilus assembly protein PilW